MSEDLEALLAPIDGEDPAGPDLSYDPARSALEQTFDTSVSVDPNGGDGGDTADIAWPSVIRDIKVQMGRTKDIWLPVYLARAGARSGKLSEVVLGVKTIEGLLDRFWDEFHPKLDDLGVPGRVMPCESLSSGPLFLNHLERVPLLSHDRLGAFSGRDFERFKQNGESEDGFGFFQHLLGELGEGALVEALAQLSAIETALKSIQAGFEAKSEGEGSPNFQPAYEVLGRLKRVVSSFLPSAGEPEPDMETEEGLPQTSTDGGGSVGPASQAFSGRIDSRDDVLRALDGICDYYRRREPSSPIPFVLNRARGWVTEDFMAVLNDLAPGSLDEVSRVLMKRTD